MKNILLVIFIITSLFEGLSFSNLYGKESEWRYYFPSSSNQNIDSILKNIEWYEIEPGNFIPISERQEIIWIKRKIESKESLLNSLYISNNFNEYEVFINSRKVNQNKKLNAKNVRAKIWQPDIVNLPNLSEGDILLLKFTNVGNNKFWLPEIFIGTSQELIFFILKKSYTGLITSIIVFIISFITLIIFIVEREKIIFGLLVFLLSIGAWITINNPLYQLLFNSPNVLFYIDKISFQLTGIAFFYILAEILNQSYKKIIGIIWKLKLIIFLISITVIYMWIEYFNSTITVFLILNIIFLVIGIASIILSLISSQYKNRIVMLGMILIMIATLSQTVISIINSNVRLTTKIIDLGTLLFVISIIWLAITYYIEMKREKERIREIEFEAVKRENKARNLFSVQLIQSQENERNRIAMELHDSIGQKLLLIKNQVLSRIRNVSIEDDKEVLEKISILSDETISEIRNITHNLRPQYLDQLGLSVAIESITEKITEISDIEIIHDIDEEIDDKIPQKDQINFFRIIQESLNNIVKHSKADQVFLKVKKEEDNIILEIRDNGIGFDITSNNEGTGLTGINERSKMLGGVLEIHSDKNGTKIIMNYPIKNDEDE